MTRRSWSDCIVGQSPMTGRYRSKLPMQGHSKHGRGEDFYRPALRSVSLYLAPYLEHNHTSLAKTKCCCRKALSRFITSCTNPAAFSIAVKLASWYIPSTVIEIDRAYAASGPSKSVAFEGRLSSRVFRMSIMHCTLRLSSEVSKEATTNQPQGLPRA